MRADELDNVLHLQHAGMSQVRHLALVGAVGDELALAVLLDPARERQRSLMHVVLAVVVVALRVLNAHREEFHQLAGIVLVGRIAGALIAIQVMEHRGSTVIAAIRSSKRPIPILRSRSFCCFM